MGWNGLDLINEFSAELGDTTSQFKSKVLKWVNDGIKEIATSHHWPFLREKGVVVLRSDLDTHQITLEKPASPTVEAQAGGSLVIGAVYKVLITFLQKSSGVESVQGDSSLEFMILDGDQTLQLSNIPFSTCPLVTERRVYISKNSGAFQYYGTIPNNLEEIPEIPEVPEVPAVIDPDTGDEISPVIPAIPAVPAQPIVFNILTDSSSMINPPDEDLIWKVDGELFIENKRPLRKTSIQDVIFKTNATKTSGTPQLWSDINNTEVMIYPAPNADTQVSFFYFKIPAKVYGSVGSVPEIPSWLYEDLRNYVIWRGYEFRDRAGTVSKENKFINNLRITISRKGKSQKGSGVVRSVTPDSDGYLT